MSSRRAASVAAGTTRRMSHAAANARADQAGEPHHEVRRAASRGDTRKQRGQRWQRDRHQGGGERAPRRRRATRRGRRTARSRRRHDGRAAAIRISASRERRGQADRAQHRDQRRHRERRDDEHPDDQPCESAGTRTPGRRGTTSRAAPVPAPAGSRGPERAAACAIAASGGAARPSSTPAAIISVAWRPIQRSGSGSDREEDRTRRRQSLRSGYAILAPRRQPIELPNFMQDGSDLATYSVKPTNPAEL